MTREEAIQWLKVINTKEFGWDEFALQESQREIRERCEQGVREAIDMAIEALKGRTDGEWREVEDDYGGVYWECSNCEDAFFLEVGTPKENNYNFCPSCGAWMERREE